MKAEELEMRRVFSGFNPNDDPLIQKPIKCKWFTDHGLRVTNVSSGSMSSIIEAENAENGQKELYGMLSNEDETNFVPDSELELMLGRSSSLQAVPESPTILKRIGGVDMQKYATFACSKECSFIIYNNEN